MHLGSAKERGKGKGRDGSEVREGDGPVDIEYLVLRGREGEFAYCYGGWLIGSVSEFCWLICPREGNNFESFM